MRLSLDTHAFLWSLNEDSQLPRTLVKALNDSHNDVLVSAVVVWEIAVKLAAGKLAVPPNIGSWLPAELRRRHLQPLAIDFAHVCAVEHLPMHHRDPFDRLLIAQARVENLTIVSNDQKFPAYGLPLLWD